jgi:hypothetical protein
MEGGSIGLGVPRLSTPLALIVCYLIRLRWEEHLDCWASIVNIIMQKSINLFVKIMKEFYS